MLVLIGFLAIVGLFALSAFWSGSEIALASLSRYRIKKLIALNKTLAAPLSEWLRSPYYLLTTILVGNTVTNMALGFLSTFMAVALFSWINRPTVEFLDWLGTTALLIVLGEFMPKVFGRANAEKVTLIVLPALSRIERITRPMIHPFIRIAQAAFPRSTLIAPVGRQAYLSLEEIRGLIAEAGQRGILHSETSQMLERVLRLGDLDAARIMTPRDRVDAVDLDQIEERFLDLVIEAGRSRVPVYHGTCERLAGYVHVKDLLWAWHHNDGKFSTDLIRPPLWADTGTKIYDLLRQFQTGQAHLAFIRDGMGAWVGIVTLEDVLEEIVGEILDEYAPGEAAR